MNKRRNICCAAALLTALCMILPGFCAASAETDYSAYGGGYAAVGQIEGVGCTTEIYDAGNGLPTSDAMFLLSASDGKMWIGGYSGVICYDGVVFERLDTFGGLTSARGLFEDSSGRIWVGTNDNGVVVIDGHTRTHLTYADGLPSSSIRIFEEDADGNVFIGTTAGICYADPRMKLHEVPGADLSEERVLKLDADSDGTIYGQTASGIIFSIEGCAVTGTCNYENTAAGRVTTIMADPAKAGKVYLGTEFGYICRGEWGKAEYYFNYAWETARPDGLYMPFAEHKGLLSGMAERCVKHTCPEEYRAISSLFHTYHKNWVKVHNSLTGENVTDKLTGTELNVAMLASRGLSNTEIGEFLSISVNSVRSHLRNIFSKLEITNRKELGGYVIK